MRYYPGLNLANNAKRFNNNLAGIIIQKDNHFLNRINVMAKHLQDAYGIHYTGLDVFITEDDQFFLIDINSAPCGLKRVVDDCGLEPIQVLCSQMLRLMQRLSQPSVDPRLNFALEA